MRTSPDSGFNSERAWPANGLPRKKRHQSRDGQVAYDDWFIEDLARWESDPGSVDQYDPTMTADVTWRTFTARVTPCAPDHSEKEIEVGNRVFALKPIAAHRLFRDWGWIDEGPVAAHGTTRRLRWPETNDAVSLHTVGVKRYEHGQMKAVKQAAHIMGLGVQEFLDGPVKEQRAPTEEFDQRALEYAQQMAAMHEQKERAMPRAAGSGFPESKGISTAVINFMTSVGSRGWYSTEDVTKHLLATGFKDEPTLVGTVSGTLSNKARHDKPINEGSFIVGKKNPAGRGNLYTYDPNKFAKRVLEEEKARVAREAAQVAEREREVTAAFTSQTESPPEHQPAVVPEPQPTQPSPAVAEPVPVGMNGSTPNLLSKVATLDGGKVLFQGDDTELYVITGIKRLEV